MRIAVQNISKSFDGKAVLKDISLTIEKPGIYALVGPNGSGKTTLMRMLALLERTDSGTLKYKVRDTEGYASLNTTPRIRKRMALIHNPAVMFSGSVKYNAGYGLRVRGVSRDMRMKKVLQSLESLSLGGFEKREARTLSAGEIQRVALARALVIDPELIFLDEPTANLDPLSAKLIEQTILELARR
ncbi:MAG: ATP-binding cassette domain-containing protein, partial [Candidatus Edwardsbacteria bacterium]|nr:ATP-binding cassette domain-containing protein [Candidatus Edwardsbacteria bacterium]